MRQNLKCGAGRVGDTWGAELATDVVCSRSRLVSCQSRGSKIATLLSEILDESGRIKIGLWDCNIEDASAR